MEVSALDGNLYRITDMIEKPKPHEVLSLFSILGRCVLPYEIFEILERTPYGAGNELQLTDAMKELARTDGMVGVDFTGKRYDMGDKFGILKASVEVGLQREDFGEEFRQYLKELVKTF
jgi:UTP--glucose-1-phosphate uridylyltransferase